jgi:hypothetical protein
MFKKMQICPSANGNSALDNVDSSVGYCDATEATDLYQSQVQPLVNGVVQNYLNSLVNDSAEPIYAGSRFEMILSQDDEISSQSGRSSIASEYSDRLGKNLTTSSLVNVQFHEFDHKNPKMCSCVHQ